MHPSPSASCRMEPSYPPLHMRGRITARPAPIAAGNRSGAGQVGRGLPGCRWRRTVGGTSRTAGMSFPGNARVGTVTPSWWRHGTGSAGMPKNPPTRSAATAGGDDLRLPSLRRGRDVLFGGGLCGATFPAPHAPPAAPPPSPAPHEAAEGDEVTDTLRQRTSVLPPPTKESL